MDTLDSAVANNVAWCSVVGAGATGTTTGIWRTDREPWPLFPDVVTIRPGVAAEDVVAALGDRPACSVKDSFADVDLTPHGFRVLFSGAWIGAPAVAASSGSSRIDDEAGLARWRTAAELPQVLPTRLLEDPAVHVLAGPACGAIANVTGSVVGVSNVFGDGVWDQLPDVVTGHAPGRAVVGYEHGEDLDAALAAGFTALGPVRVWLRP